MIDWDPTHKILNNLIVYIGTTAHYVMQVFEKDPEVLLVYVNIGVGCSVFLFTVVQIYYWIKHKGEP